MELFTEAQTGENETVEQVKNSEISSENSELLVLIGSFLCLTSK